MQLTVNAQRRRQEIAWDADLHSWGIWLSDHDGGEVFIENTSRTARRASVLAQIAQGRRQRRLLIYRGRR